MRALKFAGVVTCSLALSATTAAAAPQVLDDAALDGVVAGVLPSTVFAGSFQQSIADVFEQQQIVVGSPFPTVAPPPAPVVVITLESDSDRQSSTNGGALLSQSMTTGNRAEQARQDPTSFLRGGRVQPFPGFPFPSPFPGSR